MQICKYAALQKFKNRNVQCTEICTLAYFQIGKLNRNVITKKKFT